MNQSKSLPKMLVIVLSLASVAITAYAMVIGLRGIGYASLGLLAVCLRWLMARQKISLWLLTPGIVLVLFYLWRSRILAHSAPADMPTATFDLYALYVDGSFGTQPSIWINHLFRASVLREALQTIYEGLPLAMGIAYASLMEQRRQALKIFTCFLLAGLLGVFCYRLLPICGPAYLPFGDECFYYGGSCSTNSFFSGKPTLIDIDPKWPRNGMPSLHLAWALLIWWFCRYKKFAHRIAFVFALLTAISTMVYGEHYLVDLLAAFFFALIPWSFSGPGERSFGPRQARPFSTGTLGYLAWLVLIRYHPGVFFVSPVIPWAALLISCAAPLWIVFSQQPLSGQAR